MFEGKKINLGQYAAMLRKSRRWLRILLSELRAKGYVKVMPENMSIHKSDACRYIFLDSDYPNDSGNKHIVNRDIIERLGLDLED